MTFKKILCIIVAAVTLALALASCTDKPTESSVVPSESKTESTIPAESSEEPVESRDEPDISDDDRSTPEPSESYPDDSSLPDAPDTSDPADNSQPDTSDDVTYTVAELIASTAKELIGTEYKTGGNGPDQFDNSGLVYYCCRKYGINVPRRAAQIAEYGEEITREEIAPGDIVVYSNEIGGPAAFVGIYIGGGKFISANNPEHPTCEQNMNLPYWKSRFICGRRVV